jgi:hypothetical protein
MKSSHPPVTLDQTKAIREIEQRLAELEQMRRCIAREMSVETEAKPTARKGVRFTN